MKTFISLTALAPLVFAASVDLAAYDASKGMKWVGEVFPGQQTTLYGDVKSIHEQILALNPNYVAEPAPPRETRKLAARNKDNGFCGVFSTGDYFAANEQYEYLSGVGGACFVNANTCVRMACQDTTGIFLCNDNDFTISPQCNYLASYANDINQSCWAGLVGPAALSGQEFDTDRYNVVVGYANCNHDSSDGPKGDHWGPNGNPGKECSGCITVQ